MTISIDTIPHVAQRYETCGDYWWEGPNLRIRVSSLNNPDYEFLIGLHEMIEAWLTSARQIPEPVIAAFDKVFEASRRPGDESEPGDAKEAPYRKEHFFATTIERLVAAELGVDWEDYDNAVLRLGNPLP